MPHYLTVIFAFALLTVSAHAETLRVTASTGGPGDGPSASTLVAETFEPVRFDYSAAQPAQARLGPALTLGRCINLSNMLDAPTEGDWGRPARDDDFPFIAKAGFRTVRIPVRWSAHTAMAAPYTIDPAFLARVAHIVKMATDQGLNVILNVHHFDDLMADPAGQTERLAAIWRQIGARFAHTPDTVWFELINEPHDRLDHANLIAVLTPALAAVRERNPRRPVLIGGRDFSGVGSLSSLALSDDPCRTDLSLLSPTGLHPPGRDVG